MNSAEISIFKTEINKFCYFKKYRYSLYFDALFLILLTFFESWKIFLINMVTILMMSANMAPLSLLKLKVFWNKGYDAIISVYDVINKIYHVAQIILQMWSFDQSLVTLVLLWEKLSSILKGFGQKNHFFERWSWLKLNNLGLALGIALKFYTSVAKGL